MDLVIHMAIRITLNLRVNWPIFHNDMSEHNFSDDFTRSISGNIKLTYLMAGKWSTSVQNVYLSYQKKQKPNNNKPRRVPPISSQLNVSLLKSGNTFRGTHYTYCSIFSLNYTFQFCYYRIELKDIPHKKISISSPPAQSGNFAKFRRMPRRWSRFDVTGVYLSIFRGSTELAQFLLMSSSWTMHAMVMSSKIVILHSTFH